MAELVESPISIPNTCKLRIKSKNNLEYEISIALPPSYYESDNKYPVLYLLDSNQFFTVVSGILSSRYNWQKVNMIIEAVPEVILVGIGYPTTKYTEVLTYRSRDYTPEIDEEEYIEMSDELGCDPEYKPNSGGAAEFHRFIKDILMPYIESSYRVMRLNTRRNMNRLRLGCLLDQGLMRQTRLGIYWRALGDLSRRWIGDSIRGWCMSGLFSVMRGMSQLSPLAS